jgi:hypothetical protein
VPVVVETPLDEFRYAGVINSQFVQLVYSLLRGQTVEDAEDIKQVHRLFS